MEINISIGIRLREERQRLGFNQEDFAALALAKGVMGSTRQSQAKYEKGINSPAAPYLAAIAVHGADVQYILTGVRIGDTPYLPLAPDSAFLSVSEKELIDNYRAAADAGKLAIEATSAALAQPKPKRRMRM